MAIGAVFSYHILIVFGLEKLGYKIEIPPPEVDADLAIPVFGLDKNEVAAKVRALKNPLIFKIEIIGQYVNIKIDLEKLAPVVFKEILKAKDKYGFARRSSKGGGGVVLIEYSSPNISKPLHIGHLRNTAIGQSLTRLYQAQGFKVITANYIGDWPKQSAGGQVRLGGGLKDARRVYKFLGVDFDLWQGESFYEKFVAKVVAEALKKGVAKQEVNGPVVVDLSSHNLRSYLLIKSDGVSLYSARDLAAAQWRLKKYQPKKLIYVVGHEQELYLKQIFKTLGLMGYPGEKFQHISYGIVTLEGQKMSTRKGHVVYAEEVLTEAIRRAKKVKEVGVGAVLYKMLSQSRERDINFDWERALSLKGDSGPYIQYGYVRAQSILKKASKSKFSIFNFQFSINEQEKNLIKQLAFYPHIVAQAQKLNAPQLLTTFLNQLTQEFNRFYETSPVLSAKEPERGFRLALTKVVGQVIKNGLWALGIGVPKRM